jgi:hypothetical protein
MLVRNRGRRVWPIDEANVSVGVITHEKAFGRGQLKIGIRVLRVEILLTTPGDQVVIYASTI